MITVPTFIPAKSCGESRRPSLAPPMTEATEDRQLRCGGFARSCSSSDQPNSDIQVRPSSPSPNSPRSSKGNQAVRLLVLSDLHREMWHRSGQNSAMQYDPAVELSRPPPKVLMPTCPAE